MIYGHKKTVHQSNQVDVEIDKFGNVAAVWFCCASLPFKQENVNDDRAQEMHSMYRKWPQKKIVAMEFED